MVIGHERRQNRKKAKQGATKAIKTTGQYQMKRYKLPLEPSKRIVCPRRSLFFSQFMWEKLIYLSKLNQSKSLRFVLCDSRLHHRVGLRREGRVVGGGVGGGIHVGHVSVLRLGVEVVDPRPVKHDEHRRHHDQDGERLDGGPEG